MRNKKLGILLILFSPFLSRLLTMLRCIFGLPDAIQVYILLISIDISLKFLGIWILKHSL